MHATDRACRRARDQRILQPLRIPLSVAVLNELAYRALEVALTDRNHSVEAGAFLTCDLTPQRPCSSATNAACPRAARSRGRLSA